MSAHHTPGGWHDERVGCVASTTAGGGGRCARSAPEAAGPRSRAGAERWTPSPCGARSTGR